MNAVQSVHQCNLNCIMQHVRHTVGVIFHVGVSYFVSMVTRLIYNTILEQLPAVVVAGL